MKEFNPQDFANTAWAFATLGVRQEELLGAIAGRAQIRLKMLLWCGCGSKFVRGGGSVLGSAAGGSFHGIPRSL